MGFLNAVESLWGTVTGGIAGVVSKVKSAIHSVIVFASSVFDLVGGAWDWMVNGIGWLGDNLIGALARLLHFIEWLVLHAIPEGLSWAILSAIRWAKARLHDAVAFLEGVIHTVERWTLGQLRSLWHDITAGLRHVWQTLSAAWAFIENTAKRVANLVLHPDRLVAWILAALVLPLLRFLLERSAALLVWLFRAFRAEAVSFAHVLEDVLAKVI